jgi:hypothetical protein
MGEISLPFQLSLLSLFLSRYKILSAGLGCLLRSHDKVSRLIAVTLYYSVSPPVQSVITRVRDVLSRDGTITCHKREFQHEGQFTGR